MSSPSSKCNDWTCRVADAMNMENFCTTPNNVNSYDNEESQQNQQQNQQNQNNNVKHSYFDDARAKVQAMILRNKRIAGIPIVGSLAAAASSNRNNNNLVKDNDGATTDSDTDEEYGTGDNNNNMTTTTTARIFMISGCDDSQTSADVSNVSNFTLPYDPHGRSGGACTSALLKGTYVTFVYINTRTTTKRRKDERKKAVTSETVPWMQIY
jgi:hypothetical protein